MNSQKLPKSSINADKFFVAYPATLAAKRERLIIFRCVIGKKRVTKKKKKILTTDEVNRIPTILSPRHRTIGTIDRSLNDESVGIQKKLMDKETN